MKRIISALLLIFVLLPCVLCACNKDNTNDTDNAGKKEKFSAHSLDYFDTATTITGYEENKETFDKTSNEILASLNEYHKLFTIYNRYEGLENLCTINELTNGVHRTVTVDERIIDMLVYAKEMYKKTNGEINIAMGSVLSIWHNYRTIGVNDPTNADVPSHEVLQEAAKHTNIEDLIIDTKKNTVFISDPKMTLDVGAIAKGYAVEMIARSLEEKGITGYVLNVGGNVRTVGKKGDGNKWIAGIENPTSDESKPYVAYLELAGESLVTSGSYQRYYIANGQKYHHIIDKDTLMPAEGYTSVSIVCKNSGMADALSTALFCMPYEDGLALIEATDGAEAMWVFEDQTQKFSSGFSSYLTELD